MREVKTVTDRTILVLMEYCSKLRQVFLFGCHLVTAESLLHAMSHGIAVDIQTKEEISNSMKVFVLGQI